MMDFFHVNLTETILVIGLILLVIEIVVLGFSTFYLFFVGLAAITTSVLMLLGVVPETSLSAMLSVAVITAVYASLLWSKLKALQSSVNTKRAESDLVGHELIVPSNTTPQGEPQYFYSGIQWKLVSNDPLVVGTKVRVIQVDVGQMRVEQVI